MIQKHTTGLKMSLKLKKLGLPQDTIFYWFQRKPTGKWHLGRKEDMMGQISEPNPDPEKAKHNSHVWDSTDYGTVTAAYLLSELIDFLGSGFDGMVQNPKNFEDETLPNWKAANTLLSVSETGNSKAKPGEWGHVAIVNGMIHPKAVGHSHIEVIANLIIENIKKHKISFNK